MGSIVLLDEHTINKIAAGEVVDRPASIVKELVENSIDAGATAITVEIRNGGISYIKIVDNGKGFASDDVELAFERHATSKIRKEEDLLKITSMGFRGEALASIASISKVSLITKSKDENIGVQAIVEAGKILSIDSAAAVTGTKIEIRDVFFNVPARFKFLKKDYTEAGYIEDVITRISLSNPQISFKYVNNGKNIIQTSGNTDLKATIFDIFGKDIYQNVIPLDYENENMKVSGMIGLPSISRSTRMHQFTYINSRYIKDKTINSAIDRACQQKFAINKFAFLILNINISPSHIDVNVHPAKLEVKFDDENMVFEGVYCAIRSALEKNNRETSPFSTIKEENAVKIEQISKDLENHGMLKDIKSSPVKYDFNKVNAPISKSFEKQNYVYESKPQENTIEVETKTEIEEKVLFEPIKVEESKDSIYTIAENNENKINDNTQSIEDMVTVVKDNLPKEEILYKYVGQVFDTYIIIQIKEKMYIIDQHAAHERLLFEKIKKDYYAKDKQSQLLLIPTLVELSQKEMKIVEENMDLFEGSGFIIDNFGDNAIKISGVPNIGYEIDYKSMFKDIIDELLGASKTEKSEKEFRFIATLACKAAVKGNMKLNVQEQISLIDDMVKLDNPFTCPHGRPTAYEISKYEIERRFLRK